MRLCSAHLHHHTHVLSAQPETSTISREHHLKRLGPITFHLLLVWSGESTLCHRTVKEFVSNHKIERIAFSWHHLFFRGVPFLGKDEVDEDSWLDGAVEELGGVVVLAVDLAQFEGEGQQLLLVVGDRCHYVLDCSLGSVRFQVHCGLLIDVVEFQLFELINHVLDLYQGEH